MAYWNSHNNKNLMKGCGGFNTLYSYTKYYAVRLRKIIVLFVSSLTQAIYTLEPSKDI